MEFNDNKPHERIRAGAGETANTDKTLKNYTYTYDALNRLKSATDNTGYYNEDNILYDKNGNITKLKRTGNVVANPSLSISTDFGTMDDLIYTYDNGNRLQIVSDSGNDTYGFKDDQGVGADTTVDYTYDDNGNMTADTNKNITSITYNHLNLPVKITFGTTGNISYLYNALGQKVQKIVNQFTPTSITTTDYLGGFQYVGGLLKFFPTAEGYVEPNGSSYKYVFQYKDHLGNLRLSYSNSGTSATPTLQIVEENNYYPFGLKQLGYNNASLSSNVALKFRYNGKELQDDNIAGQQLNLYDYGARNYDPALGRWMNIDPLAEMSRRFSPYTYAVNNPVYFIDPDGMANASNRGVNNDDEFNKFKKHDPIELFPGQNDREKGKYRDDDPNHPPSMDDNNFNYEPHYIAGGGEKDSKGGPGKKGKGKNKTGHVQPTNIPAPGDLPGFPGSTRLPNQKGKRPAWTLPNGGLGEWDNQHGEVEVYDKTGKNHKGGYNPDTGEIQREGKSERTASRSKYQLEPIEYSNMPIQTIVITPLTPTQTATYSTLGVVLIIGAIILSPVGL